MNTQDPKLTALQFNEYINKQNIKGLSGLMTPDHTFIDRADKVDKGKESMTKGWMEFFASFPDYKNTFNRVESHDNLVILLGYAYWNEKNRYDPAIWTAKIENDLVAGMADLRRHGRKQTETRHSVTRPSGNVFAVRRMRFSLTHNKSLLNSI